MAIRLTAGGAYTSDIEALRGLIRANGTPANLERVTVSHPLAAVTVDLYVNKAYQPNGNLPHANGSIYVVAFGNANGIWHFTIAGLPLPGGSVAFPGAALDGSYNSLGFALNPLPQITNASLQAAVNALGNYNGAAGPNAGQLAQMASLIVAVSEAVRITTVEQGVAGALGTGLAAAPYQPNIGQIRNWGGHTLGG